MYKIPEAREYRKFIQDCEWLYKPGVLGMTEVDGAQLGDRQDGHRIAKSEGERENDNKALDIVNVEIIPEIETRGIPGL